LCGAAWCAQVKQERLLAAKPAIVVATPGRLWELMQARAWE
jgi:superfamily II DNA/RNA helicase